MGGVYWADVPSPDDVCSNVKAGGGTVLLCRNSRTGKENGVLFWGANGIGEAGIGCYNYAEDASQGDWEVGDEVVLLDYDAGARGALEGLVSASDADLTGSYTLANGTGIGWNIDAEHLRFGRCGIVGGWWKELAVEVTFRQPVNVAGLRTDSPPSLPYNIECLAKNGNWENAKANCEGNTRIPNSMMTKAVRLSWESTDMHQMNGLSTYRSGGGLHAEVFLEM